MKLTKKQIDIIIKNTRPELKDKFINIVEEIGMYTKADANWSYHAGFDRDKNMIVTVYGKVQ